MEKLYLSVVTGRKFMLMAEKFCQKILGENLSEIFKEAIMKMSQWYDIFDGMPEEEIQIYVTAREDLIRELYRSISESSEGEDQSGEGEEGANEATDDSEGDADEAVAEPDES